MNLTMGGVADMLGLSYGCLIASGAIRGVSFQAAPPCHKLSDMEPHRCMTGPGNPGKYGITKPVERSF
jgi:hypothetical protein